MSGQVRNLLRPSQLPCSRLWRAPTPSTDG
ncbi:hypothetical protein CCACVL1_18008 [Corchorus capsularis]|uniref:Uncharacterized protein n=1 Tax=Corchorus capsularis TaxID=210143 RepID=A0A1R3HNJ6_COCAP|nr:hypothetical protein CCACVL1_18008 [Corchorus capsularis]